MVKPLPPVLILDYLTDALAGMNVRPYNYLDLHAPIPEAEPQGYPWDDFEPEYCWMVMVYDNGLDYDLDGNAYFDDYPQDVPHSYHRSQKGAEIEAAHLEHHGCNPRGLSVCQGWQEITDYNKPILA